MDGLGAKPIRFAPGLEIPSGTLVQGTPYFVTYNNADAAFYLQGLGSGNPYNLPLGGLLPYIGTTAPNSAFVLPFGQAISRSTYATLFALIATAFGAGDGSTTFNVPDLRGRLIGGKDDMGGSAASRITTAGSAIDGTTLGASGGAQNVTLAQSALPNVSPTWSQTGSATVPGLPNGALSNACVAQGSGTGSPFNSASTQTGTVAGIAGTISSINGGVAQTAVNKMPPTIIVNYVLRVMISDPDIARKAARSSGLRGSPHERQRYAGGSRHWSDRQENIKRENPKCLYRSFAASPTSLREGAVHPSLQTGRMILPSASWAR